MLKELLEVVKIDLEEDISALDTEACSFAKGKVITVSGAVENYIYLIRKGAWDTSLPLPKACAKTCAKGTLCCQYGFKPSNSYTLRAAATGRR